MIKGRILYCFRRSPSHCDTDQQRSYIRKILGIIAFRKSILIKLTSLKPTRIEKAEFIEQMRIIEKGYNFRSVPVDYSTPSVNEPNDTIAILETLKKDIQQTALLKKILPNWLLFMGEFKNIAWWVVPFLYEISHLNSTILAKVWWAISTSFSQAKLKLHSILIPYLKTLGY